MNKVEGGCEYPIMTTYLSNRSAQMTQQVLWRCCHLTPYCAREADSVVLFGENMAFQDLLRLNGISNI